MPEVAKNNWYCVPCDSSLPTDMPRWYAASDAFILPSRETWGVVVLEAMAAGLPVLVSDEVGCHPDVVTGPERGHVIPREDVTAWVNGISGVFKSETEPFEERITGLEEFAYGHLSRRLVQFLRKSVSACEEAPMAAAR